MVNVLSNLSIAMCHAFIKDKKNSCLCKLSYLKFDLVINHQWQTIKHCRKVTSKNSNSIWVRLPCAHWTWWIQFNSKQFESLIQVSIYFKGVLFIHYVLCLLLRNVQRIIFWLIPKNLLLSKVGFA
jgi:hypothetical protein